MAEQAHARFDVLDEGRGFALLVALDQPLGFVPGVLGPAEPDGVAAHDDEVGWRHGGGVMRFGDS